MMKIGAIVNFCFEIKVKFFNYVFVLNIIIYIIYLIFYLY